MIIIIIIILIKFETELKMYTEIRRHLVKN